MRKKTTSILKKLLVSYIVIICIMTVPAIYSGLVFRLHTARYERIITNASVANQIRSTTKDDLLDEIWKIVAGFIPFSEGRQYELLDGVSQGIFQMQNSEYDSESSSLLLVAERALHTLEKYIQMLEEQIEANAPVAENQQIMEQIRGVMSLLDDVLEEFIMSEIENAGLENERIRQSSVLLSVMQVIVSILVIIVAVYASSSLYRIVRSSIGNMETHSSRIANGELSARIENPSVKELDNLAQNLNIMAARIQDLLNENTREQKNLQKAEMRALQAQITPHFLYNTFDTIIWLAEAEETEKVIEVTKAFSQFFRISLSKGRDWITVEQEIEHVKSYLTIQKIRYENILSYDIQTDPGIEGVPMLKLILQPLVENAIYHGIKNKRGRGKITVQARKTEAFGARDGGIHFEVRDDGMGFTEERLAEVLDVLHSKTCAEDVSSAYGLYNVNKRLELYYDRRVPLFIQSEHGKGTCISFTVPVNVRISEAESV